MARRLLDPLLLLPAVKLLLHLATYRGYGYFRDEFYYIACSRRLAFGYVDQPPLSILLLRLQRAIFGDSLFALRVLPAVAGAATILVIGLTARRLGGGKLAQTLAMTAALVGGYSLAISHFYSMNAWDMLIWAVAGYLLVRILKGDDPFLWLPLGVVLGLGLQNKISVLWLGFGLGIGLLATGARRFLGTKWPWAAAGLALAIFTPHLAWQVAHDWPTIEFIRNATGEKMLDVAPLDFLMGQIEMMNAATLPVWAGGLLFLLIAREARPFRLLGVAWLAVFALLVLSGSSRSGYLAPAYAWLLAAGGVAIESWLRPRWRWVGWAMLAPIVVWGIVTAPFALPVLPVDAYIEYSHRLGVAPSTAERKELADLPQFYADMHGWEEIVSTVASVHQSLPAAEQMRAVVLAPNYGVAGAIEHLGAEYGFNAAISGHNNYWYWGHRGSDGEIMLVAGESREGLLEFFREVELGAIIRCGYCMPYENDRPVWICRNPYRPLADAWPAIRHFD